MKILRGIAVGFAVAMDAATSRTVLRGHGPASTSLGNLTDRDEAQIVKLITDQQNGLIERMNSEREEIQTMTERLHTDFRGMGHAKDLTTEFEGEVVAMEAPIVRASESLRATELMDTATNDEAAKVLQDVSTVKSNTVEDAKRSVENMHGVDGVEHRVDDDLHAFNLFEPRLNKLSQLIDDIDFSVSGGNITRLVDFETTRQLNRVFEGIDAGREPDLQM
eukprot:TRINITY_DN50848_c0_g1_i1.p1 TRINITY_DN50848_c0_g1~~TRINITY_DN50848_c0_g1_i1.p1  ORF type:complete len:221 (-),score=41.79 TRINITY_DN50848_c0_g1_i1:74-736(-)